MFAFVSFVSLALPLLSAAQLAPTSPAPGDVFKQGSPCSISWIADTSGKWKNTFIELMTGSNQQMTHLTTVANVDGTDPTKTSISIPCPAVTPNSPIYFYQVTAQDQNATWTGRFAISDLNGATSPPPNANQPDGTPIAWGDGKLLSGPGSPPPPTAPQGQVDGSGSGSVSGASSFPVFTASTVSAPPNSTAATTPVFTSAFSASSSLASISGISSSQVPATTSSSSLSPSPATASTSASTSSNIAFTNSLPAASALVAAAILGFVTLY